MGAETESFKDWRKYEDEYNEKRNAMIMIELTGDEDCLRNCDIAEIQVTIVEKEIDGSSTKGRDAGYYEKLC